LHPERGAFCLAKDLSAPREHSRVLCENANSRVWRASLFHLFVRRMLAAPAAEFLELQPLGRSFPVLGRRIIPLFAITALQCNDFSGHKYSS
jgi:hypothetical protein